MNSQFSKCVVIGLLSLLLIAITGFHPAHAIDKSRVFIWLLFFSGLGSSAAGAVIQGQATETYDEYLHTAVQTEMGKLVDDYDQKHQQSIIASRAGMGMVIGAILLSLIDAAYIPPPEVQKSPTFFGSEYGSRSDHIIKTQTQNGEILLTVGYRF